MRRAAGPAVSEKIRAQITGLDINVPDGAASAIQTICGAINYVSGIPSIFKQG